MISFLMELICLWIIGLTRNIIVKVSLWALGNEGSSQFFKIFALETVVLID